METKPSKSNVFYIIGLIAIGIEIIVYMAAKKTLWGMHMPNDSMFFIFVNHIITFSYLLSILIQSLVKNGWRFMRMDKRHFIAFITLSCITAHTINLDIAVFSGYPGWLNVFLIILFISLHILDYTRKMPEILQIIIFLILGTGSITALYFAAYLAILYPLGVVGLVFFGLTIYLFTPLILLIIIVYQFFKNRLLHSDNVAFLTGIIVPLIFIGIFLIKWQIGLNKIENIKEKITKNNQELPEWLLLGQNLPTDNFTKRMLSSELVYDNYGYFLSWSSNLSNSYSENVTHDPLIVIAQLVFGEFPLDNQTCLKIIEFQYDARHEIYRKLWTGRDLETKQIINNIDVYPDYRMAYTESTITIQNNSTSEWSEQEALYTFKLPEGSVVSSMSLWINGKEEKSRLTTKERADSAYTSIVGYEMRDPAVLHWQEGNTVTLTIFPCTPKEERIFKLGITSPLKLSDNQLILENISFKGPNQQWAKETSNIHIITDNKMEMDIPSGYKKISNNEYIYDGYYNEDKSIKMNTTKLSANCFSFNNKSFSINELTSQNIKFYPSFIYLDINKSWTKDEFEKIFKQFENRSIYAFDNELIKLTKENKDKIFDQLTELNFSIFPIYEINNPSKSLLISKSTKNSPNLDDLKGTIFAANLNRYLSKNNEKIKFVNLDENLTPYLKSLNEFKIFNYMEIDTDKLIELTNKQLFSIFHEEENSVNLALSGIKISMHNLASKSGAPDHLMRLYAYNKIMQQTGNKYFNIDKSYQDSLVPIANEAYIVSPVSSLIVLETQKDYERFDIQKNVNSLENAAKHSSGAVPEPHEWVLIVLAILFVGFLYYRK